MSVDPRQPAAAPRPGRRWAVVWAVVAASVLVAAVALVWGRAGGAEDGGPSAARAAASAPPADGGTATAEPPPTAAPVTEPVVADSVPPALPAVALDERVEVEAVTAALVALEPIEAEARGRGSVAGPALLVTVRLENGAGKALDLDAVTVNLYHGADRTPGSPVEDPRRRSFAGTLDPGSSAEGRYTFSVPADARDAVTVEVAPRAGATTVVFTGPVD